MFAISLPIDDMNRSNHIAPAILLFAIALVTCIGLAYMLMPRPPQGAETQVAAAAVTSSFSYSFKVPGTLYEAGSMGESTSPYWWLNSGAKMTITGTSGQTAQGDAQPADRWRILYNKANPLDTDLGAHPQNLFRLISRNSWDNVRLTAQFRIINDNLSLSPNRNASNGLLFMSRYVDGQTLYYAGIRVDGTAVIKKKYHGVYYTMAQKKIFPGAYSATSSPNLLPHQKWIALRSETVTESDGSVSIRLYMQQSGTWTLLASGVDDGKKYGGTPAITGSQFVGIRTDFMDVEFKDYRSDAL